MSHPLLVINGIPAVRYGLVRRWGRVSLGNRCPRKGCGLEMLLDVQEHKRISKCSKGHYEVADLSALSRELYEDELSKAVEASKPRRIWF